MRANWTNIATNEALRRSSHTLTVLPSPLTAHIFGGELLPRQPRDNALHTLPGLNISSNSPATALTTLPTPSPAPAPRVGTASTALNGKLYLFSGRGGESMDCLDESGGVWCFDPQNSASWELIQPKDPAAAVPEARSYHAMAADPDSGHLYLHAGCPVKGRLRDLWRFDVGGREWKELTPAPGAERGGTSVAWCGGRLWRMNGFDGQNEVGGSLEVYEPTRDVWESLGFVADGSRGPGARSVAALLPVRIEGRPWLVTCFGESDPSALGHKGAGKMLGDVWAFDVEGRKWEEVEVGDEGPEARGWFGADVLGDGQGVVVAGGLGESNERLDDAWVLTFEG
ncbi:hypothetical protein MBLNU230_g4790t1 [Neophaeotheca triangularis]